MRSHNFRIQDKQAGVSLLELLIAMIIGLLVTGGAIQLFITNKATYRVENSLSRLQETGRYVVDAMAMDIRMAGYNGCSSRGNITPALQAGNDTFATPPGLSIVPDDAIRGENGATASDWYTSAVNTSDAITLMRANACAVQLIDPTGGEPANSFRIQSNNCNLTTNDVVMITDCAAADVFRLLDTDTDETTVEHAAALSTNYSPGDSQVQTIMFQGYFVAPSVDVPGEQSLWRSVWSPDTDTTFNTTDRDATELVTGVEQMQIEYGIDNAAPDEYADTYVDASAVTDWSQVRSVRINLLLQSDDGITTEPRSIAFNGGTVNTGSGADNRLRMVYSSTITLRNRLP
ncbi:MAG: PilW family protein [Thiotrichales bacterium]|nr:PilW family protein [Thiotrichales bacterium]